MRVVEDQKDLPGERESMQSLMTRGDREGTVRACGTTRYAGPVGMVKKRLWLLAISCLVVLPGAVSAQDWRGTPPPEVAGPTFPTTPSHVGTSPFSPRTENDTLFVVDEGSGLDTGCTYRSGGPLQIHLLIKRFVGPVAADGTLIDPNGLVQKGLISAKAHIRLPAFDIDVNGAPGYPPEVDRISFNGHDLGTLTGDNNIWKLNEFDVPIAWVKFPVAGSNGAAPASADNLIQINIDEASAPSENWCASVDWVEIEFSAIAPIFLVHGVHAQGSDWEPHFTSFLAQSGAPWSNDINLDADGTIQGNGRLLSDRLTKLATSFGARKCHIIAHSKGGLDTRAYLNTKYDPKQLQVLSVYTLSTPHHGSILSDIAIEVRKSKNPESPNADLQYLISKDWLLSGHTATDPALSNLATGYMAKFNEMYGSVPGGIVFYNYGADADTNDNSKIEADETNELISRWSNLAFVSRASLGTALYRTIGNTASITVTKGSRPGRFWGENQFTSIEIKPTASFAANDLAVSVTSAHSPFGTYLKTQDANHGSMKSTDLAMTILDHIRSDFPNH
jgi:triacylglycerol lipase